MYIQGIFLILRVWVMNGCAVLCLVCNGRLSKLLIYKDMNLRCRSENPVINVSYWDAVDYCEWLNEQMGNQIRLPTEAEWEYACRARTTTAFWYGDEPDHARMHCRQVIPGDANQTKPVGMYEANAWGVKDMHGNVQEWCASEVDESYQGLEQRSAMSDRSNGNARVLRGGSWLYFPDWARSAARD